MANSTFVLIGATGHSKEEREKDDFYATDGIAITKLIDDCDISFKGEIWEPACGTGNLSKELIKKGYKVKSTDLVNRGYGISGIDFLKCNEPFDGTIITNPPYKYALEFINHSLDILTPGNQVYMFLKIQFLESKKRKELFDTRQLKTIYITRSRISCAKNNDFKKYTSSATAYAWYCFEKGYNGDPIIKWFN